MILKGCYGLIVVQGKGGLTLERKAQQGKCIFRFDFRSLCQFFKELLDLADGIVIGLVQSFPDQSKSCICA